MTPSSAPYAFSYQTSGRCGTIICSSGQQRMTLYWEMSGAPDLDMALAPLDLGAWESGDHLTQAEQLRLLHSLREWLIARRIRSDVATPAPATQTGKECRWKDCSETALACSAYCTFHYDLSLLR